MKKLNIIFALVALTILCGCQTQEKCHGKCEIDSIQNELRW